MIRNVLTISCLWLLGLGVADTQASIIAANYLGGGDIYDSGDGDLVAGWGFTPTANLRLTGLGVYDLDRGGLNTDHQIGVFRASDGANLAVGSVQAGTGNTLIAGTVGGSRMDSMVFDVGLSAGVQYYIVASYAESDNPDDIVYGPSSAVTFAPEFSWDGYIEDFDTADIFDPMSIDTTGVNGDLGPTFTFVRDAVPEPTSFAIFGLGCLSAVFYRRRR